MKGRNFSKTRAGGAISPTPPPHQHPPLTRSNELTFIIGVNGGWGNSFEFISIKFHSFIFAVVNKVAQSNDNSSCKMLNHGIS